MTARAHLTGRRERRRRGVLCVAVGLLAASCTSQPTEVLVAMDTDAPASRMLTIRATVRAGDALAGPANEQTFTRGGALGTAVLPGSFAITPGAEPLDGVATLVVDAVLAAGSASEPPIEFRRIARFAFVPHAAQTIPIFLAVACGNPTTGCRSGDDGCTVAVRCEDEGFTCGDDGSCVPIDVTPVADASVMGPRDAIADALDAAGEADAPLDARDASTDAHDAIADAEDAGVCAPSTAFRELIATGDYSGDTCTGLDRVLDTACAGASAPEALFHIPYGLGAPMGANFSPWNLTDGFIWYEVAIASPSCTVPMTSLATGCGGSTSGVGFNPDYTHWIAIERGDGGCGAFTLSVTRTH